MTARVVEFPSTYTQICKAVQRAHSKQKRPSESEDRELARALQLAFRRQEELRRRETPEQTIERTERELVEMLGAKGAAHLHACIQKIRDQRARRHE